MKGRGVSSLCPSVVSRFGVGKGFFGSPRCACYRSILGAVVSAGFRLS